MFSRVLQGIQLGNNDWLDKYLINGFYGHVWLISKCCQQRNTLYNEWWIKHYLLGSLNENECAYVNTR